MFYAPEDAYRFWRSSRRVCRPHLWRVWAAETFSVTMKVMRWRLDGRIGRPGQNKSRKTETCPMTKRRRSFKWRVWFIISSLTKRTDFFMALTSCTFFMCWRDFFIPIPPCQVKLMFWDQTLHLKADTRIVIDNQRPPFNYQTSSSCQTCPPRSYASLQHHAAACPVNTRQQVKAWFHQRWKLHSVSSSV